MTALKDSRKRYYLKTRVLKGYPKREKTIHPKEYRLFHSAKTRAKMKSMEFSLNIEDIIIPKLCPVLGIPISISNKRNDPNSPSIDRLDSKEGYTKENTRVISWRANKLKSDAEIWELQAIVNYIEKNNA